MSNLILIGCTLIIAKENFSNIPDIVILAMLSIAILFDINQFINRKA